VRITVERLPGNAEADDLGDVAVVLPAYNEERHVAQVLEAALATGVGRLVCVNDCSADRTGEVLEGYASSPRVSVLHHEVNMGKQAAVKHGLALALADGSVRRVATLDADTQHDPSELPRLAAHVPPCDMVCAARRRRGMPSARRLANALANWPYRLLAGLRLSDPQSGFRLYSRAAAEYLAENLRERGGYTVEHTSLVLLGEFARMRGRNLHIGELEVNCPYAGVQSHIRLLDNLQLTWAAVSCAARLAALLRA